MTSRAFLLYRYETDYCTARAAKMNNDVKNPKRPMNQYCKHCQMCTVDQLIVFAQDLALAVGPSSSSF